MSVLDRLYMLRGAFRLATYGIERQVRTTSLLLFFVVIVGSGLWYLNGTVGPRIALNPASGARGGSVAGPVVGPGHTASVSSQWPTNCKSVVVNFEFQDKNGTIVSEGYLWLQRGNLVNQNYWGVQPSATQLHASISCADYYPVTPSHLAPQRLVDSRTGATWLPPS